MYLKIGRWHRNFGFNCTVKKKSVLADLKAKKKDVAKQPRKKRIIDNI